MKTLLDRLQAYAASPALPMHMPGHKRSGAFPWLNALGGGLDITEIDGFDNLNDPQTLFRELESRAARLWHAQESLCLVGGSTVGVLAALRGAVPPGGEVLLVRGCHRSVYHGAELANARVHTLLPPMDRSWGIWGSVPPAAVEDALQAHPGIRLVALTSPTYEGVLSDVAAIAAVCHAHDALLFVDEAHGAHLGFGGFPANAMAQGADLAVQSLHKTLPSLTQTAVLHLQGSRVDRREVRRNVGLLQTSSPSYLLSASIDGCVDYLERCGDDAADRWLEALAEFAQRARGLSTLECWNGGPLVWGRDPSKLVLSGRKKGLSGPALMGLLRERYAIETEMAGERFVLAMTGMGDTPQTLSRLANALEDIDRLPAVGDPLGPVSPPPVPRRRGELAPSLRAAGRLLPLSQAVGQVSGEYVWAYPPGAPLLLPGEEITPEIVRYLQSASGLRSTRGQAPERIFCIDAEEKMV